MTEPIWQPESTGLLAKAIKRIERELPGWWWSGGACSISAHASIGPDMNSRDKALLAQSEFDEGFHADLAQPAQIGEALNACIDKGLAAKRAVEGA
jgi:hypothetical protein